MTSIGFIRNSVEHMKDPGKSFATRWNVELIDEYYAQWQRAPDTIGADWQAFFEGFELGRNGGSEIPEIHPGAGLDVGRPQSGPARAAVPQGSVDPASQARFLGAIYAYRSIGHTQARFNPIKKDNPNPRLSLERLGFTESDLDRVFDTGNYLGGTSTTLRQLLKELSTTYCGSIGAEYLHIQETKKRRWLQAKMEPILNLPEFTAEKKINILRNILEGELFETFLHTRYVGQKRFGLEGGETLIPSLRSLIEIAPSAGIKEIVIGMAHRGRLNVLANIFGKSYKYLFQEFSANYIPDLIHGDGDVKYHLGYTSEFTTGSGAQVSLHLAANPSHLEAVNPVVEGRARAKQRILGDSERKQVLPLLIHGDAALAGQGLVCEVLNLSKLAGYTTGGTIHIVINNQIGFTTDPTEARSSLYCTDVAKMIEAPIFHVNGDDPIAMVWITELALDYRQEFGEDVVIDMYCYRRHGHNEIDEPSFTQPKLYKQISKHPLISETYSRRLSAEGVLTDAELAKLKKRYLDRLDDAFASAQEDEEEKNRESAAIFEEAITHDQPPYSFRTVKTSVRKEVLDRVAGQLTALPESFKPNAKIKRQLATKANAYENDTGIDWAFAESLAWGSLMLDGIPVRLSGQDCARGTFSQRHAILYDIDTREHYVPLMALEGRKAIFCVHNSLLSEAAVLGFDYGYSLDYPQMLCMWEAQFGDFANGAQVIIDQFVASSESKWMLVSGIVMLLPHGYEGQGPEHSSARIERYLQLCAEENIQVCNLTTPAQYFHVLRRQVKRDFRKPLIIAAPKSLLRNKEAVSPKVEFLSGQFREIIADSDFPANAERVVLCSGKIYYELVAYRAENKIRNTTIVRVEQFYPFHHKLLNSVLAEHPKAHTYVWCQEEPNNMGAWSFLRPQLEEVTGGKWQYAGRDAGASTAVGSLAIHKIEQSALIKAAFEL